MDNELADGDIVLVRARPWLRWLCQFDHAGIIWLCDGVGWMTVEAGFSGVRVWRLDDGHWGRPYVIIRPATASVSDGWHVSRYALELVGWPYAFGKLAGIMMRLLKRKLHVMATGFVCSELAAYAWSRRGFVLCPDVPLAKVTPDDLWDAVKEGRADVIAA